MAVVWRGNPEGLDATFCADITALLADLRPTWYVLEGWRSMARSAALNAAFLAGKGPRAAPPGKSAHNYGLAVDVVLDINDVMPGLQPSWDVNLWQWVQLRAAVFAHPRLKGGWTFGDWPHIERYRWQQYAVQQGIQPA